MTCAVVCTLAATLSLVAVWLAPRPKSGGQQLGIRLARQSADTRQGGAVFVVSNSTSRPIGGRADPPQIYTNGAWSLWSGPPTHDSPVFYLQPGQTTNVQVVLPENCKSFRVPFLWDYNVRKTRLELLRLRVENFIYTLKTHGHWYGWRNTGSFTCRTSFWDAIDWVGAEPGAAAKDGPATPVGNSDGSAEGRHR